MRNYLGLFVLLITLVAGAPRVLACSTFLLSRDGRVLVGKSYDWDNGAGMVVINKRGVAKKALVLEPNATPATWTSKYESVTFNQYGREFPNEGMNEAGLTVDQMWLDQSQYPLPDSRPALIELAWIQYQLDNFARVAEVEAHANDVRIADVYAKVHYLVCDSSSACTAFEWLDGKLVASRDTARALTNDSYADSMSFLRQHVGFGGSLPIPTSTSSLDRFVRAVSLSQQPTGDLVDYAFHVLDGVSQGDHSKWNIVFDPATARVWWRSRGSWNVKTVALGEFDGSCRAPVQILDLTYNTAGEARGAFSDYNDGANRALVQKSLSLLPAKLPPNAVDLVAGWPTGATRCAE